MDKGSRAVPRGVVGSVTNQEGSIANGVHAVFATVTDQTRLLT